jgi:hypothetical protein
VQHHALAARHVHLAQFQKLGAGFFDLRHALVNSRASSSDRMFSCWCWAVRGRGRPHDSRSGDRRYIC